MNFVVFKKKTFLLLAIAISLVAVFAVYRSVNASSPKADHTIVIDAGHGGIDGGAIGKNSGVCESDLNLAYAKTLQSMCEDFGYEVIMTRTSSGGLYSLSAKNKKRSDMLKRKEIILSSGADIVVSLHMNSFPLSSACGAQAFYASDDTLGFTLAECVQEGLTSLLPSARQNCSIGDYYILSCTDVPSVLVECGYLSNAQEEELLQQEEYRQKLCYAILSGILSYFKT